MHQQQHKSTTKHKISKPTLERKGPSMRLQLHATCQQQRNTQDMSPAEIAIKGVTREQKELPEIISLDEYRSRRRNIGKHRGGSQKYTMMRECIGVNAWSLCGHLAVIVSLVIIHFFLFQSFRHIIREMHIEQCFSSGGSYRE